MPATVWPQSASPCLTRLSISCGDEARRSTSKPSTWCGRDAAVEAVALDHDAFPGPVVGDVVRPGAREGVEALGVRGQRRRHGAEERRRRPSGEVGHRLGEPDDERVPLGHDARRGPTSAPPGRRRRRRCRASDWAPGDATPGASVRLIARANALARTGVPSLKRKPVRNVNVYVRRSRETFGGAAATSGTGWKPAEAACPGRPKGARRRCPAAPTPPACTRGPDRCSRCRSRRRD